MAYDYVWKQCSRIKICLDCSKIIFVFCTNSLPHNTRTWLVLQFSWSVMLYWYVPTHLYHVFMHSIARDTRFTNNNEIVAKRQKNGVRRIVYKRCLPCFANRFFTVRSIFVGVAVSLTNTKNFFVKKKIVCRAKIDGKQ